MASSIFFLLFAVFELFSSTIVTAEHPPFHRTIPPASLGLHQEKLTHLHFYFHDIVSGPNQTAFKVAQASITDKSPTLFGEVLMADDPLTVGPEPESKLIGKAQGIYASASQDGVGLMMVMNIKFLEGKYNGSTMSLLGRNAIFSDVREMPIVGGSGLFRFARGYALAKTHSLTATTAIVEYNVYNPSFLITTTTTTMPKLLTFYRTISPTYLGLRKEKLTHFHFYFHDVVSGPNPSAIIVDSSPRPKLPKTPPHSSEGEGNADRFVGVGFSDFRGRSC
ncbi:hypothetical protein PIB30_000955 [Stylosanthes scabra]|uniref:Dirigent protein n=1 Tax=Stylosanthes scabra TaxID=79078 RepID=A0ABU6S2K2_9FABA|nr:hypothetical protein [Stylosanthes scabra]